MAATSAASGGGTAAEEPRSDFKKFTLQELQAAIDHFWPNHVCGEGSYGVVYKGLLDGQQVRDGVGASLTVRRREEQRGSAALECDSWLSLHDVAT